MNGEIFLIMISSKVFFRRMVVLSRIDTGIDPVGSRFLSDAFLLTVA